MTHDHDTAYLKIKEQVIMELIANAQSIEPEDDDDDFALTIGSDYVAHWLHSMIGKQP